MTRRAGRRGSGRARAAGLLAVALLGAGALALAGRSGTAVERTAAPAGRAPLMVLTTLPLIFGEEFGLEQAGSPALQALERRYTVVPVSTTAGAELKRGDLLLMAHPLAQTAEALVELDAWVRRGGRLLLLADPALDWHSERPLGDTLRPPPSFADTGLLIHWGLRLDAPDERGPAMRQLAGQDIMAASPGRLSGRCAIAGDGFVARCRVGKGQATIVADADFLNVGELDGPVDNNLRALLAELTALERG